YSRLIPHLGVMSARTRSMVTQLMILDKPWSGAIRETIVQLAGDSSADARSSALEALRACALKRTEVERLQGNLARKTGDLRRGVLSVLPKQKNGPALASARRLLAAKDVQSRQAGLELLRMLMGAGRVPADCRQLAEAFRTERPKIAREEQVHLDEIF